jgi:nicotinamidase-related amidase
MKTALILVDIQNDYFPGGKMELEGSPGASLKAQELLAFFRLRQMAVVHIQHIAIRPGATFFLPDTAGVEIHADVQPLAGELLFHKHYPNSFRDTPLLAALRTGQISELVICGMMTHLCIDSTTRAAHDLGFNCLVAGDACATRPLSLEGHTVAAAAVQLAFLAALNGSFGSVLSTAEIIARLNGGGVWV